jgi:hypothetical protein
MGLSDKEIELIKFVSVIVCITVLEVINIVYFKVDGVMLSMIIGSLFGLLGYKIGSIRLPREPEEPSGE